MHCSYLTNYTIKCVDSFVSLGCTDACTPWSPWTGLTCSATCDYGTAKQRRTRMCALPSCNDTEDNIGECKTRTCTGIPINFQLSQ